MGSDLRARGRIIITSEPTPEEWRELKHLIATGQQTPRPQLGDVLEVNYDGRGSPLELERLRWFAVGRLHVEHSEDDHGAPQLLFICDGDLAWVRPKIEYPGAAVLDEILQRHGFPLKG